MLGCPEVNPADLRVIILNNGGGPPHYQSGGATNARVFDDPLPGALLAGVNNALRTTHNGENKGLVYVDIDTGFVADAAPKDADVQSSSPLSQ